MLNRLSLLLLLLIVVGCKNQKTERVPVSIDSKTYALFGEEFDVTEPLSVEELAQQMDNQNDTLEVILKGNIKEVCSKKGCWMTLPLGANDDLMVRFKDYGFFVPLDASGEVLLQGKAFISETSIEDLRHYAEDAGASQEEIKAITSPKRTYSFEASGVLLAE